MARRIVKRTKKVRIPVTVKVTRKVRVTRRLTQHSFFVCGNCGLEHVIHSGQVAINCACGAIHYL